MTRYREAFSWTRSIDEFVRWEVTETPLLNVCAGRTPWGDVTLDKYEKADVQGEWTDLPFERDSFGAVFADPPWDAAHKTEVAAYMREALRVAPVAYLMAPWLYGAAWCERTHIWVREFPGVHVPILLTRYERSRQVLLFGGERSGVARLVAPPDHWHRRSTVGEMSATVSTGSLTCSPPEESIRSPLQETPAKQHEEAPSGLEPLFPSAEPKAETRNRSISRGKGFG